MPRTSLCLLVALILVALPGCAPKLSPATTVLESVERKLSGAEAQQHSIDLPAAKYFLIEVEQLGIDAIIEVRDPHGKSIVTVNTPTARVGSESALLKTTKAGDYRVLVRSNEHAKKKGSYRLAIEELGNQTWDDKRRLKAEEAMTEAARLNFEIADSSGSDLIEKLRADAIEQYEIAESMGDRIGSTELEAWALYYKATQYLALFEWKRAAEIAQRAVSLFDQAENQPLVAIVLRLQAEALTQTRDKTDFQRALDLLREAMALHEAAGNTYDKAITINTLGGAYYRQGELAKAREHFVKASDMFSTLDELQQAIWTSNNIAVTDEMLGNYAAAVKTYKKALNLSESGEYPLERAFLLKNLANAYAFLGSLQEALLNYREAAALFDSEGDRLSKARALSGTALTYSRLGNWEAALGFFEQAIELQGSTENSALVTTYIHKGNALRNFRRPLEALKTHEKALELAKLPEEKTTIHVEIGRDYAANGNYSRAINHYNQALQFANRDEAALARAFALQERGQLKVTQDINISAGLVDLQEALQAHRALHSESGEAQTLQAVARAKHKLGNVNEAIEYAAQALDVTETLRLRVGSPNLRISFTGLQLPTYELHIALLMELANSQHDVTELESDYAALALEVSERARARSLVELLTEANADKNQGIDSELLRARSEKRQELAGLAYRVETLSATGSSKVNGAQKRLQSVQVDLDVIEAKIRKQNLEYAELTQPPLLTASDIQGLLTPAEGKNTNTVLLEYSLGEEQSFLWYVTKNSIESWSLPGRAEIEAAAREVYNKLKTLDVNNASRRAAQDASARLADIILEPVVDRLKTQRVVIIADGALQYIPFGVLPISKLDGSSIPLLTRHEVVTLPSASTLAVLRKAQREREPAKKSIAIFADPIFNQQDTRLAGNLKIERHASMRASEERGRDLLRLTASGREADAIARLAAPERILKATGFAASRSSVLNIPLSEYRYVHFATHGLINSQYPELSSLALSAFDEDGKPQPGFLRLYDIYGLKLNADLVVLSACEAALGQDIRGEGLIGLTRGFMYAGSARVVASLWRASDAATAALMQEFYRLMFKQGLEPADALRKAQLAISGQRKWRDPYYWAGFVLQGDWR